MTTMNVQQWIWCLHCERCFSVLLSKKPKADQSAFDFGYELEVQLGVELEGQVYAECPYDDCDAGPMDFWWWENLSAGRPDMPEVPEMDTVYPLYPPEEE